MPIANTLINAHTGCIITVKLEVKAKFTIYFIRCGLFSHLSDPNPNLNCNPTLTLRRVTEVRKWTSPYFIYGKPKKKNS